MKKLIIISALFIFALSCAKKEETKEVTLTIDFSMPYGELANSNGSLNKTAKLKVDGGYGSIDAKPDAVTGASAPAGATKLWDNYRYVNASAANGNKLELDLGYFVLYGIAPYETYVFDGMTGNGFSQKMLDGTNGPKITGTKIEKSKDGVITIKYAHAGGPTVYPFAYEMVSDTNGVFKFGYNMTNNKRSVSRVSNDIVFEDIEMTTDIAKSGVPYWQGDLQGAFENNIFTLKGTLTERK